MGIDIHDPNVRDPYKAKECFINGYEKKLKKFTSSERKIIRQYVLDMQRGKNVNGGKGGRGYRHLNSLLSRLTRISFLAKKRYNKNLVTLSADDLLDLFDGMRSGQIVKDKGKGKYKAVHDYIKIYKAFFHWYQKIKRKEGKEIEDITIDLSGTAERKPDFVYFNFKSLKKMMDNSKFFYKVLILFMYDSGIRVTELLNIKRKDCDEIKDIMYLNIREETSKTFGRKIKLMICKDVLNRYFKQKDFAPNDFIFQIDPRVANQYVKRLGEKVFGKELKNLKEHKKDKKNITLYDFRHSSACYWLPKYKSESALKYRFGWKRSEMIHYYTELLGMKDTITEDDLVDSEAKSLLQKENEKLKKEVGLIQEQLEDDTKLKEEVLQLLQAEVEEDLKRQEEENAIRQEVISLKQELNLLKDNIHILAKGKKIYLQGIKK